MDVKVGDRLPEAKFLKVGDAGPEEVALSDILSGRKVILFALPGAFTRTCSSAHLPSFIKAAAALFQEGVEEIACISVNDPFVMKAWGNDAGADEAGLTLLADADGSFTKAMGMEFDAPAVGLYGRSNRYALLVDDGEVTLAQVDEPGVCEVSTGENMLDQIREMAAG